MNMSRARRRWTRWDRYTRHCRAVGGSSAIPLGHFRTEQERAVVWERRWERRARRDAHMVVRAVLEAYLPLTGGQP